MPPCDFRLLCKVLREWAGAVVPGLSPGSLETSSHNPDFRLGGLSKCGVLSHTEHISPCISLSLGEFCSSFREGACILMLFHIHCVIRGVWSVFCHGGERTLISHPSLHLTFSEQTGREMINTSKSECNFFFYSTTALQKNQRCCKSPR